MPESWVDLWQRGYGPLTRHPATLRRLESLADRLLQRRAWGDRESIYRVLAAADRLASAAMWLVAHMTYARKIDLTGAALPPDAFKTQPDGQMGGQLNIIPAFVGYLTANVLSGRTRSWIMGQGHCGAAIDAVNALTGDDISARQKGRHARTRAGLSKRVADCCYHAIGRDGRPAAAVGSHAGPDTAGVACEGGYLGSAEFQYIHMPLRGESLVAFFSPASTFGNQQGVDWSPRWWRAEDCGLVTPVMILNGRRIDEDNDVAQEGGAGWLDQHLRLGGFDPIPIDGDDPAAFAWAILETEERLKRFMSNPDRAYPAALPYVVAKAVKGFGFTGEDSTRTHNLPLTGIPRFDEEARQAFNAAAAELFVPFAELEAALGVLQTHVLQHRPLESGDALAARKPPAPLLPIPTWSDQPTSPLDALDAWFVDFIGANPFLRPRIGNLDELRSNHMGLTLDRLQHRVNAPEGGSPESIDGAVITALNGEAVAGAALGNKAGLNLIVSCEAFAVKMLGGLRQEIIFARHQREAGLRPGWVAIPLIATSHTWENCTNWPSHQDPIVAEVLMGEMSDTARVLFPIDANSAVAALRDLYTRRGQIGCLVTPARILPTLLDGVQATSFVDDGAIVLAGDVAGAEVQFVAIGAYQTAEALKAHRRLGSRGRQSCVVAVLEPGRLREPRDVTEATHVLNDARLQALFPLNMPRVILSHTRPEPMLGVLRRLDGGPGRTKALGFVNRGGTVDVFGVLLANRCSWAHAVSASAHLRGVGHDSLLDAAEALAIEGRGDPRVLADRVEVERQGHEH
jgi:phosphoketolase